MWPSEILRQGGKTSELRSGKVSHVFTRMFDEARRPLRRASALELSHGSGAAFAHRSTCRIAQPVSVTPSTSRTNYGSHCCRVNPSVARRKRRGLPRRATRCSIYTVRRFPLADERHRDATQSSLLRYSGGQRGGASGEVAAPTAPDVSSQEHDVVCVVAGGADALATTFHRQLFEQVRVLSFGCRRL